MDSTVLIIFGVVYLGMILGEIPGLALDRTGVALLGAIALLATGRVSPEAAWLAVDVPTLGLLLGLMVVSAQFRLGGFYDALTRRLSLAPLTPPTLLALLVAVVGLLSALLANDIVCLAMAPILAEGCTRRGLNPVPFLLGLACAANVGSAATLIGNPQNMLVGQRLGLPFGVYMLDAAVPAAAGLAVVWWVIAREVGGKWHAEQTPEHVAAAPDRIETILPPIEPMPFIAWQTAKGMAVLAALVLGFLFTRWPREVLALAAAGLLLASRRMASRRILGLVDWQLLVLFIGLFVVNHALATTGMPERVLSGLEARGVDLTRPGWLFGASALFSNIVSNVPAVMLLLPAARHPLAGPVLALSSTLAGNLLVVGSIANIIVIDHAARLGLRIGWREHARVGIPVTLLTLALAAAWLAWRAA